MSKYSKRGDLVWVKTIGLYPQLNGIYQIKKHRWWSNYPYQVEHEGELILIEAKEITTLGEISCA